MKNIKNYVIAILMAVILVMMYCGRHGGTIVDKIDTVETVSYVHDTIQLKGKTKIKPVAVIKWLHDTIVDSTTGKISIVDVKKYTTIDTFEYKTDSFTVKFYTTIYTECPIDSVKNDLIASVRHKIIERVITKEIVRAKALFAGTSINLGPVAALNFEGQYEHKGKMIYKLGVGITTKLTPTINAGIYWKIGK
jgi:hypothetical protein